MYQKCVYLLFLVILAVLSCSGFHIDNSLAMADFSKKNSIQRPHKIRHHRLWRTQAHSRYPPNKPPSFPPSIHDTGFIAPRFGESTPETHSTTSGIWPSNTSPTTFPNENLAQIPPTDFAVVVSRAQRSSDRRQRRARWTLKQSEDIFTKAFNAKLVVLADVESKSINEANNGSCQFYAKVMKDFKGNAQEYFGSVNRYLRHIVTGACDLVKEMKISRKYVLLLNKTNDKLLLVDVQKPKKEMRATMRKRFNRVCKPGFVPTKPQIVELKEISPKSQKKIDKKFRILMCTVKGFPLPRITWRRSNEILHHNKSYNVLYKSDEDWRQSKLVIKKHEADSLGEYECIAESLNGLTTSKNFTLKPPPPTNSCPKQYETDLCQNGGTCFFERSIGDYACVCPDNFSGKNCQLKLPSNTSMYPQPDLYACKLGLATKYNC